MQRTDAVVIGAGPAGLAMSQCLARRGVDHIVLERGGIADRWRRQSWDSLRLLTPNWLNRLPGASTDSADPDGFIPAASLIARLESYADSFAAPVVTNVPVRALRCTAQGFAIDTLDGCYSARAVVIATGQFGEPSIPRFAAALLPGLHQLPATDYRRPSALPDGGVLVVGASASGIQIAGELNRAGRDVMLSTGSHTRLPRTYRGYDIMWWLDRLGVLDERADRADDLALLRRQPSLQLAGGGAQSTLDLATLREDGVRVLGRACDADSGTMSFAGDLAATTADAQRRLDRLLAQIDAAAPGLSPSQGRADPPCRIVLDDPSRRLNLRENGIRTVIWATGFAPRYRWLHLPVLDAEGAICHSNGIVPVPGLYVLGMRWLRRRSSSFIRGIGRDAEELADHVSKHLASRLEAA